MLWPTKAQYFKQLRLIADKVLLEALQLINDYLLIDNNREVLDEFFVLTEFPVDIFDEAHSFS